MCIFSLVGTVGGCSEIENPHHVTTVEVCLSPESGVRHEGQDVRERADAEHAAAREDLGVALKRHLEKAEQGSHLPLVHCRRRSGREERGRERTSALSRRRRHLPAAARGHEHARGCTRQQRRRIRLTVEWVEVRLHEFTQHRPQLLLHRGGARSAPGAAGRGDARLLVRFEETLQLPEILLQRRGRRSAADVRSAERLGAMSPARHVRRARRRGAGTTARPGRVGTGTVVSAGEVCLLFSQRSSGGFERCKARSRECRDRAA